jgi:hypothetical protein
MKKTITVNGFNGPKQVTKEQFVSQWTDHALELSSILSWAKYCDLKTDVIIAAQDRFEEYYAKEQGAKL